MENIKINYGCGGSDDDDDDYDYDPISDGEGYIACPPPPPPRPINVYDDPQPSTSRAGRFVEDEDRQQRRRLPTQDGDDEDDDEDDDDDHHHQGSPPPSLNVRNGGREGSSNNNGDDDNARRMRSGRKYFITITFLMNAVRLRYARLDFLRLFDRDDLTSYCVSLERNYGTNTGDDDDDETTTRRRQPRLIRIGLDGSVDIDHDDDDANKTYHLHAYLNFKRNQFLADVREYLRGIYVDERIDVQLCRSSKTVLIYVSKEDHDLITNVKLTDLSFNYQAYRWALRTSTFNHADPFVVRYNRNHHYLKNYLTDLKFALAREASARVRFSQKDVCYRNWTMDVCQWWNRYCCDAVRFQFKRPCLYLYGRSDVGKTTYVESLIGRHNLRFVFRPGIGNFFMQDFRADFHRVILFEEFDCKAHNLSLLRRLCEGRYHAFPVKCDRDLLIAFRGPIIFVANFDDVQNEALRSRLLFVHASVPYWESERVDVPKAEEERNEDGGDNDDENTIVISSTSSSQTSSTD